MSRHEDNENDVAQANRRIFKDDPLMGIQDEYFDPPPKVLTDEENKMVEQIKEWILMEQDSIRICKRLNLKESILKNGNNWEAQRFDKDIKQHEENIKKFEAKIKEIGV